MKKILSVLLISIIISYISIIIDIKFIFISIIGILFLIYCYKNTNKCFWLTYFLILSLPISKNNIINYITIEIGGIGINIFQILVSIIFIITIIKRNKEIRSLFSSLVSISFLLLCILYFIYFIIGVNNKNEKALSDLVMYVFQMLIFYCTFKLVNKKDDIYKLLNITFYGLTISCSLSLLMLITNKLKIWGITYDGGRYGGNFITMLIITISYIVILLYNKDNRINKLTIVYSLIISILSIMLSQNRTNPILLIISCILILLININSNHNFNYKDIFRKLSIIIFMISILSIILIILFNSEIGFVERFKNITSISEDVNMKTRVNTNNYYIGLIKENPFGSGFGTLMPFVDSEGIFRYNNSLNIDNTYINIARKAGIVTVIIYIYMILSPIIGLIKIYRIKKDNIYISAIIFYFMLIIASSVFTSQSIHSYAVSTFIWVFIGFINVKNITLKEEKIYI